MQNLEGKVLCKHMEALVIFAKEIGVEWDGCGDCGSPWLTCNNCFETQTIRTHERQVPLSISDCATRIFEKSTGLFIQCSRCLVKLDSALKDCECSNRKPFIENGIELTSYKDDVRDRAENVVSYSNTCCECGVKILGSQFRCSSCHVNSDQ